MATTGVHSSTSDRFTHVRVNVRDLDAAIRWYERVLGVPPTGHWPPDSPTYAHVDVGPSQFAVGRYDPAPATGARVNFEVDDVDEWWTRLGPGSDVVEPLFQTPYGSRKFTIRDLDGNGLGVAPSGRLALAMAAARSVVVNGDLGSGKSTVSRLLSQRLGIRRISVGDLYREMARQRGMTALELNRHAELDDKIDHYVDQLQRDIATSGERLVVDSRLAWVFFRDALKVHLVTDPTVAACRVIGRPADAVERYQSMDEARRRLAERSDSERQRFIQRYGADKTRLRNYDVVCDSTRATPEDIVARILQVLSEPPTGTRLFIDPGRIHLTDGPGTDAGPVRLGYARPHFFAVTGRDAVDAAVRAGHTQVAAVLAAEARERINGRSAYQYFAAHGS